MISKKKKKITITIDRNVSESINNFTTNKSRLVEMLLVEYLKNLGIDTSNIYL
jgi:hypothetical protein